MANEQHKISFHSHLKALALSPVIIYSLICLLIISAYWPSLNGPLVFDDQLNITENPGVAIEDLSIDSLKKALLSNESGRLKRILPALSFGVNYYFSGGFAETFIFKTTNLVIHIINTALLFWLAWLLTPKLLATKDAGSHGVLMAALIASVWALHPLQLTPVTYVVQRMTSMAATFMLLGLCVFVIGRLRYQRGQSGGMAWMYAGVIGGTLLGLMCKENAALLPLYVVAIETTLLSHGGQDRRLGDRRSLWLFYAITVILPVVAGLIYCFVYPGNILSGYLARPFSLSERLLTEARVLWFYLSMLAAPDITVMGLFHDDLSLSKGWLSPWTTLVAVIAWLVVVLLALRLRKSAPVFAFAVFWYLLGHSMESSFIPLKLIYEHRNYMPVIGPIVLFVVYGAKFVNQFGNTNIVTAGLTGILIAGLYSASHARAEFWRSENSFIASIAANHPLSANSQYLYGEVLYKKLRDPFQAYPYYFRAAQLQPDEVGFLISVAMVTPPEAMAALKKQQASELIDPDHITEMLRQRPISAWGLRALDVAGRCIKAKHASCASHVDIVRQWLNAAIINPRLGKAKRHYFTNHLFDIEMGYGLYHQALKTVLKARQKAPSFARYELMLADALAATAHYQQALTILTNLERRHDRQGDALRTSAQRMKAVIVRLAAQHAAPAS
ncbi:hypothetical protein Q9L42_003510 [Methylomarinum sp. Ch1-1]|uniref:Tetratricopeptide repeat protein n=1 Tax=Methylomarinum roseum TaxID=3067653 RepID=A0AAU7NW74_9GAMM